IIYGGGLLLAVVSLVAGTIHLLGHAGPAAVTLPLGLPWIGAHFRLDALSAFFIVVVDLGAATASLFSAVPARPPRWPRRKPTGSRWQPCLCSLRCAWLQEFFPACLSMRCRAWCKLSPANACRCKAGLSGFRLSRSRKAA